MDYERITLSCRDRSYGELEYVDFGEYSCPVCGFIHHNDDYEYDSDDSERLSVSDAAQIWTSYGKDEDYMFSYMEEELEYAL